MVVVHFITTWSCKLEQPGSLREWGGSCGLPGWLWHALQGTANRYLKSQKASMGLRYVWQVCANTELKKLLLTGRNPFHQFWGMLNVKLLSIYLHYQSFCSPCQESSLSSALWTLSVALPFEGLELGPKMCNSISGLHYTLTLPDFPQALIQR